MMDYEAILSQWNNENSKVPCLDVDYLSARDTEGLLAQVNETTYVLMDKDISCNLRLANHIGNYEDVIEWCEANGVIT